MQLSQGLEEIGTDVTGDRFWFYEKESGTYYKTYENKKDVYSKITGINLPNPFQLENTRLSLRKKLQEQGKDVTNFRIECTRMTHKLWEHWNSVKCED